MSNSPVDDRSWWDERYDRREDGWESGVPAPPLVRLLEAHAPPRGRIAVLGCGRGHDAREFARRGYAATGFDFSERAVAEARRLGGASFERRDLFSVPRDRSWDLVWEYTCFCAIDPARRREYADLVRGMLRPGGLFLALFYPLRAGDGGPPFPVSRWEVELLFSAGFRWVSEERPHDSLAQRRGFEWLVRLERT